jgi:hypothetical protein
MKGMKKYLLPMIASLGIVVASSIMLLHTRNFLHVVKATTASHVVISEIQVGPGNNDFVELYNPTNNTVDISSWTLKKKTSGATAAETSLVTIPASRNIAAHGFYLITNDQGSASPSADLVYASSIGVNNTLILRDSAAALVDKVGMGSAQDYEGTGSATLPNDGESIERKACAMSSLGSMSGDDATNGNSEDTDNNADDFVPRHTPDPQNSSITEAPGCAEATATPTNSASPAASATASATPTVTPTPTPTETPEAIPTEEPTATPTATPSPTATASPTASSGPSTSPAVTASPHPFPFFGAFSCQVTYKPVNFGFFILLFPSIRCGFGL